MLNSFGRRTTLFCKETTFATGRAQAAKDALLRLGSDKILGFAVGGLRPRFRPKRFSLALTASRLCPRRTAICAALCPEAQSLFSSAKSSAAQFITNTYTLAGTGRLVVSIGEPLLNC